MKNNTTISRKDAIKKKKYAALTATGTFLILNPKTAQACSCGTRTTATNPNAINW